MTGVSTLYYSTASNADSMTQETVDGEREQSLLHTKLYEKNASLSREASLSCNLLILVNFLPMLSWG